MSTRTRFAVPERDPVVLAEMDRGALRAERPALVEALTGLFSDHHGYLLAKMLARIDAIDPDVAEGDRGGCDEDELGLRGGGCWRVGRW